MSKDNTVVFHTCKGLGRAPETLVEACDEVVATEPALELTAIADGRALTVPVRDIDARWPG